MFILIKHAKLTQEFCFLFDPLFRNRSFRHHLQKMTFWILCLLKMFHLIKHITLWVINVIRVVSIAPGNLLSQKGSWCIYGVEEYRVVFNFNLVHVQFFLQHLLITILNFVLVEIRTLMPSSSILSRDLSTFDLCDESEKLKVLYKT